MQIQSVILRLERFLRRNRKRFQAKRIILELLEGIGWAIWLLILLILSCGNTLIYLLYLAISIPIFIQRAKYDCRSDDRNLCNSMHNTVTTEKEEREDKGTDDLYIIDRDCRIIKGNIINSDFIGILTNLAFLRDSLKKESLNDVIPKSLLMDIQVLLNTNEEEISLEDFRTNVVRMINVVLIRLQGIYKLIIYS